MLAAGALQLAALAAAPAPAPPPPRDTIHFNKGWRFRRGDPPGAPDGCPAAAFPVQFVGAACDARALTFAPLHDPEECRKACCSGLYINGSCTTWMYLDASSAADGHAEAGCYLASHASSGACVNMSSAGGHNHSWAGGSTGGPPPPPPPPSYEYAAAGFDADGWASVDVPYDFVLRGTFAPEEKDAMHGYLPRNGAGWFNKQFQLPAVWEGSRVSLEFDGVFHVSRLWLNGAELDLDGADGGGGHRNGYTSIIVRLDNVPGGAAARGKLLHFGPDASNTIALRADASFGSGHWYEGGGIYRPVRLVRTALLHLVPNSLSAVSTVLPPAEAAAAAVGSSAAGAGAGGGAAVVRPTVRVRNGDSMAAATLQAEFSLVDDSTGDVVAAGNTLTTTLAAGDADEVHMLAPYLRVAEPKLWSVRTPTTYTLCARVLLLQTGGVASSISTAKNATGTEVDAVNVTVGIRSVRFDAARGFFLNDEKVVLRGFSDHNSMAGVGAAIPQRIHLFRAQMLRALGGNIWR